jgi:(S)-citramalyl-CoA lyase
MSTEVNRQDADRQVRPRRSFIFTPGLKPAMYPKALASGADIVCVELEDGIAPKDKDAARANALALFAEPQADDGVERVVRINCLHEAFGLADVTAVLQTETPPPALMLPKVKTPEEIVWLDDLLSERGHDTRLHVIIETNAGLEAVQDIARASSRIDALFFGGVDMAAELRCRNAWEPLLYARSRIVHAAASVGLDVLDVPWLDLDDPEGMKEEAARSRDLGFSGKGSVHPKQISILNDVFTPDEAAVAHARRIIEAFREADTGLVVVDGKLIEKPVLREMHRILSIADRLKR